MSALRAPDILDLLLIDLLFILQVEYPMKSWQHAWGA